MLPVSGRRGRVRCQGASARSTRLSEVGACSSEDRDGPRGFFGPLPKRRAASCVEGGDGGMCVAGCVEECTEDGKQLV